ncbi:Glucosyltransferase-like protein [Marasmius tenuissimus]|uniref:dolichyl-P-Glc:Man9GlcNAc2-PP-dolichol alpha-1,3-glucosyltransferase n=1 Tax=Marasmius tenuissimus TaxID=585030 RepID=A0ABR3A8U8_9AGAR
MPEATPKHTPKALSIATNQKSRNKRPGYSIALSRVDPEAIPPIFWLGLMVIVSIIFVVALATTFRGVQLQKPYFKDVLDEVAKTDPGIVLLGENVDVDVDEPSITFRWSILACGQDFVLPNSTGIHDSDSCGLPAIALKIFVDGENDPVAKYDPTEIPFNRVNGKRRNIQSLSQFDSDHVLDVHQAYLFPFDTYKLSSTIRAVSNANETLPIRKLATIDTTSSFSVISSDVESYSSLNSTSGVLSQVFSRDIDLQVRRPVGARTITLFLFSISWFLAHICIGSVYMASKGDKMDTVKKAFYCGVIIAVIPQLRNSMPDAPGLDGILLDSIGYFPQMLISGLCLVILMVLTVSRELNETRMRPLLPPPSPTSFKPDFPRPRPPPIPLPDLPEEDSTVAKYNKYRITKHLKQMADFPLDSSTNESTQSSGAEATRKRRVSTQGSKVQFPRHRLGSTSTVDGRRASLTTAILTDFSVGGGGGGGGEIAGNTAGRQHSSSPDIVAPLPRRHLLSAHQSRSWLSDVQSNAPPSPTSSRGVSPTSTTLNSTRSHNGVGSVSKRLSSRRSLGSLLNATPPISPVSGQAALDSAARPALKPGQKSKEKLPNAHVNLEEGLGRRFIRWSHKRGMKDWVSVGILLLGVLLRLCIGLGGYSGAKTPPMYGDYEAQRHWMELTVHLPILKWYTYDLQYWGLDYPPLTAYVSWLCGKVGAWIQPSWFALDASRGIETTGSKLYMRLTVIAWDLLVYVPAIHLFKSRWLGTRSKRTQELAFLILMLQPALLLIDFGHFQYNSVMLGFTILAMDFFASGHDEIGAVFFVLSLGFKQMALYYAPAIGTYLIAKCILLGPFAGTRLFLRLGITTSLAFVILFLPFLPPFAPLSAISHPITRIFPFARGLFEDKVANFWCASNVVFKWKNWAAPSFLVKVSGVLTLLGFLPGTIVMLRSGWKLQEKQQPHEAETEPQTKSRSNPRTEPTPLLPLLPYTLLNSSMSFFLFSFQVHEKTILLPLMPITLLLSGAAQDSSVFAWGALVTNTAIFSMWPLLKRDGLGVQYIALLLLWNRVIGHNPLQFPVKNFLQFISINVYVAVAILHFLEMVVTPPERYPDLFPVLNVLVSTPVFVLTWLWSIKCCVEVSWAIGGLGGLGGSTSLRERTLSGLSDAS